MPSIDYRPLLHRAQSLSWGAETYAAIDDGVILWQRNGLHSELCVAGGSANQTARPGICFPAFPPPVIFCRVSVRLQTHRIGKRLYQTAAVWSRLAIFGFPLLALVVPVYSSRADVPVLTNDWCVKIGVYSESSAAVGKDGAIYFGTWDHKLWALNPDGSRRWVFEADLEIRSSPAVSDDGTVYFGSRDRKFYCVGPDGKKKWAFQTGAWIDSSPALATDGTVYFGSWDMRFYALTPQGTKKWEFITGGPIESSPAIDTRGRICFGSHDHKFYMLAPDGTKVWEFPTGGAILSSPAIGPDGATYFTSVDGFCYALNEDGTLRWRLHTGGITESSPIIGLDNIIYVGVNKNLWAILPNGRKKWERPATTDNFQEPIYSTPVALADDSILLISGYALLTSVAQNLEPNWWAYLPGHTSSSPALGTNGVIYINGNKPDGYYFQALRAKVPLAVTSWPKFRGDPQNSGRLEHR